VYFLVGVSGSTYKASASAFCAGIHFPIIVYIPAIIHAQVSSKHRVIIQVPITL
jgi:hypothetical protein